MSTSLNSIFREIKAEREYQDREYGGPKTDDKYNGPMEWLGYISKYSSNWLSWGFPPHNKSAFRTSMIRTAALAVAAIEQCDRLAEGKSAYDGCSD